MNDWTQVDATHWETDIEILMWSPTKIAVINAGGYIAHFVACLPDKPNYAIPFWQMKAVYDDASRIIAYEFDFQGVHYTVKGDFKAMRQIATEAKA